MFWEIVLSKKITGITNKELTKLNKFFKKKKKEKIDYVYFDYYY